MANTSQTYSTETSIQNDFKIFLGKKNEIVEILAAGKVVDRKWYLAWDTGEIYIGNKLHKLMKFGGSNEDITSDTVKDIISEQTSGNFNEIRKQMTKALAEYTEMKGTVRDLQIEYGSTLASFNENMRATIQEKITEVLSDYSNITYSKTDIDNKINRAVLNVQQYIQSNYVDKNELATGAYATEEYVNTKVNGSLLYVPGNTIRMNKSNRVNGLFFATSNSDDGAFERAHIYYLVNGASEDMTPAGTGGGGGGAYVPPTLTLGYRYTDDNGQQQLATEWLLELGESFTGTRSFEWSCSSPAQVNGMLTFSVPATNIPDNRYRIFKDNINPGSNVKTIILTSENDIGLQNPAEGEYSYVITGVDKQGGAISAAVHINVVGPIYFGEGNSILPDPVAIQGTFNRTKKRNVAGEYTVTIQKTGRYAWICIPNTMSISGFALSGFRAPFEEPVTTELTFGSVTTLYKCYRSTESLQSGHVTITVV